MDLNGVNEFRRGEVWYVDLSTGSGVRNMGRPAVIVSIDEINLTSDDVTVAYLTTAGAKGYSWNVPISAMARDSWVKCNNLDIVNKDYLRSYRATLSEDDMKAVAKGIRYVLGLGDTEESPAPNTQLIVERDMYKKLYEAALEKLVGRRLEEDIVPVKKEEVPPVVEVEDEYRPIDLNSCGVNDLAGIGIRKDVAAAIIAARPYTSVDGIRKIPGVTSVMYGLVKNKLEAAPPKKDGRLNINTASIQEMMECFGICKETCKNIERHRRLHGKYTTVDDLLVVKNVTPTLLARIRGLVTV